MATLSLPTDASPARTSPIRGCAHACLPACMARMHARMCACEPTHKRTSLVSECVEGKASKLHARICTCLRWWRRSPVCLAACLPVCLDLLSGCRAFAWRWRWRWRMSLGAAAAWSATRASSARTRCMTWQCCRCTGTHAPCTTCTHLLGDLARTHHTDGLGHSSHVRKLPCACLRVMRCALSKTHPSTYPWRMRAGVDAYVRGCARACVHLHARMHAWCVRCTAASAAGRGRRVRGCAAGRRRPGWQQQPRAASPAHAQGHQGGRQ